MHTHTYGQPCESVYIYIYLYICIIDTSLLVFQILSIVYYFIHRCIVWLNCRFVFNYTYFVIEVFASSTVPWWKLQMTISMTNNLITEYMFKFLFSLNKLPESTVVRALCCKLPDISLNLLKVPMFVGTFSGNDLSVMCHSCDQCQDFKKNLLSYSLSMYDKLSFFILWLYIF